MKNWFMKNLGDALLADDQQDRIKQCLLLAYTKAGGPDEMAAFIRHESEGRLHCEVKIYCSPMSAQMAKEIGAEPCEKPSADGLSMLVGPQGAWQVLFPEHPR